MNPTKEQKYSSIADCKVGRLIWKEQAFGKNKHISTTRGKHMVGRNTWWEDTHGGKRHMVGRDMVGRDTWWEETSDSDTSDSDTDARSNAFSEFNTA